MNVPFVAGVVTGVQVSQDRPSVTVGEGGPVSAQRAHVTSHLVIRHQVMNAMEGRPWNLALRGLDRLFEALRREARVAQTQVWLATDIETKADAAHDEILQYIDTDDGSVVADIPAEERSGRLAALALRYIETRARLAWTSADEASQNVGEAGHAGVLHAFATANAVPTAAEVATVVSAVGGLYEFRPTTKANGSRPALAGQLAARHFTEVFTTYTGLPEAWYDDPNLRAGVANLAWAQLVAAAPTGPKSWAPGGAPPPGARPEFDASFVSVLQHLATSVHVARIP
ncbi:hypothetical protein [Cellulomonas septica]|uniref:DUF3800 domain-containing protein n=1 Tax=Cellulomonas septica TaxID=285080 RepID=A0ABX1JVZ6_9CELL|nr:hypothetical protein [Cellulomonas septica]NKY38488.1 hypothetical protein [Cellulomonas septica]